MTILDLSQIRLMWNEKKGSICDKKRHNIIQKHSNSTRLTVYLFRIHFHRNKKIKQASTVSIFISRGGVLETSSASRTQFKPFASKVKSLALKPASPRKCPVLGLRTALYFGLLKRAKVMTNFVSS